MSRHLVINLWLPVKHYKAVHNTLQAALPNLLTGCRGSFCPGRTGALWAAGSSSAGRTDPLSSRCSPAGGGPISGRTFLQMTGRGRGGQQRWASLFKLNNSPSQTGQYLAVCKLAVLQVLAAVEGPDAGVGVVVGVLTHAVRETLLDQENIPSYLWSPEWFILSQIYEFIPDENRPESCKCHGNEPASW